MTCRLGVVAGWDSRWSAVPTGRKCVCVVRDLVVRWQRGTTEQNRYRRTGVVLGNVECGSGDVMRAAQRVKVLLDNRVVSSGARSRSTVRQKGVVVDIVERAQSLALKIRQHKTGIETEEATKNAFVMPFISTVLGYDVFNPAEVIPEFTADVGIKKGEKIDYAIVHDGQYRP